MSYKLSTTADMNASKINIQSLILITAMAAITLSGCAAVMRMDSLKKNEDILINGKSDDWREYPYLKYFNSGL